ncbi:MAG TPA: hypothetical protein VHM48_04020 [Candidatus Limnocylindrales bacterium]|nr:hypothetical protein [Candidatus Limnocylindrales bacterium]
MSGYIAAGRVVRASPRLAAAARTVERATDGGTPAATEARIVEGDGGGGHAPSRLSERRSALRERWSQLTFYLFDPNSWR